MRVLVSAMAARGASSAHPLSCAGNSTVMNVTSFHLCGAAPCGNGACLDRALCGHL